MNVEAAGATLCRAFFTDPAISWAVPRDDSRRAMQPWFTGIVRLGERYGEVKTEGVEPRAVAVCLEHGPTFFEHVAAGLSLPTLGLGPQALWRFLTLSSQNEKKHIALCPEPHVYLYFLGVDPAHQGKGLGSALLKGLGERADSQKKPCYLETATAKNVPLYQRHGFDPLYEGQTAPGGPHFWLMKRRAR